MPVKSLWRCGPTGMRRSGCGLQASATGPDPGRRIGTCAPPGMPSARRRFLGQHAIAGAAVVLAVRILYLTCMAAYL
ncbi:twin-arginine translocation signal domain-containing protein [Acidovorax delafieldii]|uniref:twin-arginine translocation signal domain-containing protein n=1 Tax=Acidovorax delafieldii TaxID=47920 RepID=UPI003CC7D03B